MLRISAAFLLTLGSAEAFSLSDLTRAKSPRVSAPEGFSPPEPKPLTVTGDVSGLLTGSIGLALRLGSGVLVTGWQPKLSFEDPEDGSYALKLGPIRLSDTSAVLRGECARPGKDLILYEYEASPFCRKVREACGILDLTVEMRPCPGARYSDFSDELEAKTGRRTVPYLIDPNTNTEMFESDDIIDYLFDTYGPGREKVPFQLKGSYALASSGFAALARGMAGSQRAPNAREDNEQMKPLELWGYEASPFVKPVRERLCALGLPHRMIFAGRGSANRDALIARTGKQFQVPYLVDPNTGIEMFESIEICKYLEEVYTVVE